MTLGESRALGRTNGRFVITRRKVGKRLWDVPQTTGASMYSSRVDSKTAAAAAAADRRL